ncbi:hypothetical protein Tco_0897942 [Tanacetum coccineum]
MLGPGRYSQWRINCFLRYIDTKANGEYLRKCIFDGPYKLTSVVIEAVAATVNAPAVPEHDEAETVHNMSEENKLYFKAEKEAIFLLLTGIGDEIYSTVDACNTANEMWTAIERLQQGESLNIQDVKTNLFWEFGKFTSRDGEYGICHDAKEYRKPKWGKDYTLSIREKLMSQTSRPGIRKHTVSCKDSGGLPKEPVYRTAIGERTNLDETGRALGEATSCRDSCLIALQNKQNEFEKYKAFNDRTIDYDILQTKLNETLGLLARKDIDIKEEIDELESEKADFSNIYDLLLEECVSKDVICSYLHSLSDLNAPNEINNAYSFTRSKKSVNKTNVSDGSSKQVTQQNLPQNRKQAEVHTNTLTPGMYRIATSTTQNREPQLPQASRNTNPHVSISTGVNHSTSVSRPPLKSYQVKDKVVPNNSQVKFTKKEVEDHHRISSISKKTKSVTTNNDS